MRSSGRRDGPCQFLARKVRRQSRPTPLGQHAQHVLRVQRTIRVHLFGCKRTTELRSVLVVKSEDPRLTRRDIVTFLDGDVLRDLKLVDCLQNREALANRVYADILECRVIEVDQDVAGDAVFCGRLYQL